MKKIFFATLAVAALALSCQKNEVVVENPTLNQAIEFSTYSANAPQTKGVIMDDTKLKNDSFGITAFYTGTMPMADWTKTTPNFMHNQLVSYNVTSWAYTPIKYWPTMDDDMVSFYAYAPYANSTNGIVLPAKDKATDVTSLTFTVADKAADMIDFVAANAIDETQNQNAEGGRGPVTFNFHHELSRLAFMVKASENLVSNTHIFLKSAELVADGTFYKSATYTWSDTEGALGTWSNKTAMTGNYNLWTSVEKTDVEVGGYTNTDVVDITSATAKNLLGTGEYLFLIPETAKDGAGSTTGSLRVKFTYDIVTPDANLAAGHSITPAEKIVDLPAALLKQNTAYNITFTFNMDQIEVTGSVTAWETAVTGDIDVPFTPDEE